MKKAITLKTIADKAGISTAAVSMILSNSNTHKFSKETIDSVISIANEYEYKTPRSLRRKKKILVVCPFLINPYYAILVQAIEQKAFEFNCITSVFTTYWRAEREKDIFDLAKQNCYDGIIFTMIPTQSDYAIETSKTIPIVIIGDRKYDMNLDAVDVDNGYAGRMVAEHLIDLGHKNIAYISTEMNSNHSARILRFQGLKEEYERSCHDGTVTVYTKETSNEEHKGITDIEYQLGLNMTKKCLAEHPEVTAIVGMNDMISFGIVDALMLENKRIPEDFSVASFDNIYPSHFSTISLTSVDYCIEERGHKAVQIIVDHIDKPSNENSITRIEYRISLARRNSTGKARTNSF